MLAAKDTTNGVFVVKGDRVAVAQRDDVGNVRQPSLVPNEYRRPRPVHDRANRRPRAEIRYAVECGHDRRLGNDRRRWRWEWRRFGRRRDSERVDATAAIEAP